jgi:hypothetical protein
MWGTTAFANNARSGWAVVFGHLAGATGWNIPNDAAAPRASPERLLSSSRLIRRPDCMEELGRVTTRSRRGRVKLAPPIRVHPLDPHCREIYGYCQRDALPVLSRGHFVGGTLSIFRDRH